MAKLNPKTRASLVVIEQLLRGNPKGLSAYELQVSMATLAMLERRGLVSRHAGLGSMFSPRTATLWRITPAGTAAVNDKES